MIVELDKTKAKATKLAISSKPLIWAAALGQLAMRVHTNNQSIGHQQLQVRTYTALSSG